MKNNNCISLRAGLIIGNKGSSFQIIENLIKRSPLIFLPPWTKSLSQPISITNLIKYIRESLKMPTYNNQIFELGGGSILSYENILKQVSLHKNNNRNIFIRIPNIPTTISAVGTSLITGAPLNLSYPLVESLSHTMLPNKDLKLSINNFTPDSFIDAISFDYKKENKAHAFKKINYGINLARSVQRVSYKGSSLTCSRIYFRWLSKLIPFFKFHSFKKDSYKLRIPFCNISLLTLEIATERSSIDRTVYFVTGGLLVKKNKISRFEFRQINQNEQLIILHDFEPRLPWLVYSYTQAWLHYIIMQLFRIKIKKIQKKYVY